MYNNFLLKYIQEHLNKNIKLGGGRVNFVKPELGHMITFSFDTFIWKSTWKKTGPFAQADKLLSAFIMLEYPAELNIC